MEDCVFSDIGKDAPSTCESLSANKKVTEWIKSVHLRSVDEECESVTSLSNEEMLNHVQGINNSSTSNTANQQWIQSQAAIWL